MRPASGDPASGDPASGRSASKGATSGNAGVPAGAVEATTPCRRRRRRRPARSPPRAHPSRRRRPHADADRPTPPGTRWSAPRHFPTTRAPRPAPHRPARERRGPRTPAQRRAPSVALVGTRPAPADATSRRSRPRARSAPDRPRWGTPGPVRRGSRIDAVGGREPERRATGEHHCVDALRRSRGSSSAISRVAGAPPRTSADPTVPGGAARRSHRLLARPVAGLDAGDAGDHVSRQTRRRLAVETTRANSTISRVDLVGALVHQHVAGAGQLDQAGARGRARRCGGSRAAA